jgi:hypothetical protein
MSFVCFKGVEGKLLDPVLWKIEGLALEGGSLMLL